MRRLAASAILLALVFTARGADAASLFDPLLHFRRLPTEHFVIYFHQGENLQAGRLAAIAEATWHKLERPLGVRPPRLTHVVLVDQTELANGFTYVLPRDTIVIYATWPSGAEFIGNTDDWLTLVFTHEFTHVVHLDRSEGWARVARAIFGRNAIAFPNLYLPGWQIEGLATYEESALTGEGRAHAGDFQAIVAEAARRHAMEPIDRANGGLIDWPAGLAQYAYGEGFHAYLAKTYGDQKLAELAEATARRVPYTGPFAFEDVFGKSLTALWRDYEAAAEAAAAPVSDVDGARRITSHGFSVSGPRFTSNGEIVYSAATPEGFPSMYQVALDGSPPRTLTRRYLGKTTAVSAMTIFFDRLEVRRNTGLYSDLYAMDRASGRVRKLTSDRRLRDPDLSPDGNTIVATESKGGQRDLVLVRLKPVPTEVATLISEPETQFDAPRWSPDGKSIAVQRHRLGSQTEIVVVDVASKSVRVVASDPESRWITPAWTSDGRAIIAAADLNGGPFNLYELALGDPVTARQITHTTGGAMWPDMSPDGKSLLYVGYTIDGFDLFTMTVPPAGAGTSLRQGYGWSAEALAEAEARPLQNTMTAPPARAEASSAPTSTSYNPVATLKPTWWTPVLNTDSNSVRFGAFTSQSDVLGYHGYTATATWLVSTPSNAPHVDTAAPLWQLTYVYARWLPTLWASASRDLSFFAGPPTDAGVPATGVLREQQLEGGVILPHIHVGASQTAEAALVRAEDEFTYPDRVVSSTRTATRLGWSATNSHTYGYSISPEGGVLFGATAEWVMTAIGASGNADGYSADVRAYLPGAAAHHVVALRAAGGVSTGDRNVRRAFDLGGGQSNASALDFGAQAISLLRGFPSYTFAGTHVALVNADYRLPLWRPERGAGWLPVFLRTVHGSVFADVGHAWTQTFHASSIKTSFGVELASDVVAGYSLPFTLVVGIGRGHDGSHTVADQTTAYFRVGRAF